jgi:hypothetical protein
MLPLRRIAAKLAAIGALCSVVAFTAPSLATAQSLADEVTRVDRELSTLRGRLDQLGPQYLRAEGVLRAYTFANAYMDARYYFQLEDYVATAEVLQPIVENAGNSTEQRYDEVVYLLAESLFLRDDLLMAGRYYQQLSDSRQFGLEAARRRLEIALQMGRYDNLEQLFQDLETRAGGDVADDINFVRGKALYFQGRYVDAITALGAISPGSLLYDKGRYFVGVSQTRLGQLDRAHGEFGGILGRLGEPTDSDTDELRSVRDLARIGVGRLFYEEQEWLEALGFYSNVPRHSVYYPAALYELSWTQIRQGNSAEDPVLRAQYLATALNNLEILQLVADDDSRFQSQARLLRGDLLVRMEEYDEAVTEFARVVDETYPVERELGDIRDSYLHDRDAFYDALVNPAEASLRLPAAAVPFMDSNPEVERALRATQDVVETSADVAETIQLIQQLDVALNSGGRINAFPQLREGWGQALEIQATATELATSLVDAEGAVVSPGLAGDSLLEFQALNARRLDQQATIGSVPRTFAEIGEREQAVLSDLNDYLLDVHSTQLEIERARGDLAALHEMYIERAGANPTVDLRSMRAEIDHLGRVLDGSEAEADELRRDLLVHQVAVGLSDDVGAAERLRRSQFLHALREEAAFLAQQRGATSAGDGTSLAAAAGLLQQIDAIDSECERFYVQVDRLVAEQTAGLRDLLERERAAVESYGTRLVAVDAETRSTTADVAYAAFLDVYSRFSELTLRASLGIIDVAWQQKEELTVTIERLFEERNQSIRELDADFSELLEEE